MAEQRNKLSLFVISAVLFCIYCFVFGDSGMLERLNLQESKARLFDIIDSLKIENQRLVKTYKEYRDARFHKEEASKIGYIDSGERVVFFKKESYKKDFNAVKQDEEKDSSIDIEHLRILWIVISAIVLIIFTLRLKREGDI